MRVDGLRDHPWHVGALAAAHAAAFGAPGVGRVALLPLSLHVQAMALDCTGPAR